MITKHLSNGIPVIFENYEGPTAAIYWWVQTGAVDEKPHEAGFAHFLEHMHFKDTDAKSSGASSQGKLAKAVEDLGGDINAYTSFEQTVYHATVADVFFEKMLPAFTEIAAHTKFSKSDFDAEKEVVLEELKKNEDSSSRMFFQNMFSNQFKHRPYAKPVIGYEKILRKATVKDLEEFYRRQYVSGNMGLVVVTPGGEPRYQRILKILERGFGSKVIAKKPSSRLSQRNPTTLSLRGPSVSLFPFQVSHPSLAWSFGAPDICSPDLPALEIAMATLGSGEASRLHQALFYGAKAVTDIQAGVYIPKAPGLIYFSADVDLKTSLSQTLDKIMREVSGFIKSGGPTREEIERTITTSESEKSYALQSSDGIASRLGHLHFNLGDPEFDLKHQARMKALHSQDVCEALTKWYLNSHHTVVGMVPEGNKKSITPQLKKELLMVWKKNRDQFETSSRRRVDKVGVMKSESLPEEVTLKSGLRVLFHEREHSKIFSMYLTMPGGVRRDLLAPIRQGYGDIGLSNLMAMVWTKGTELKSSLEFARAIENRAANFSAVSGRHTLGLDCTGLKADFSPLSELFLETLLTPRFDETEVELAKKLVEESLKSIEDNSQALTSRLFLEALFQDKLYGWHPHGTIQNLNGFNPKIIQEAHRQWLDPKQMILSVCGAVSRSEVIDFAERLSHDLIARGFAEKSSSFSILQTEKEVLPALTANRWVDRNLKREQKHVFVGGLGISMQDKRRVPLKLLMEVLGGQSGRLFMELREKRSLAYSVYSTHLDGIGSGYVGTYIACSPDKVEESLQGIRKVYEDFVEKGPSPQEMKRIRAAVIGKHAMGLQSDSSMSAYMALERLYGFKIQTREEALQEAEAITAKQLQSVCRELFVEPYKVTSVVG